MAQLVERKDCPMCGLKLPPNAKVCEFCGWSLNEEEDDWVSRMEGLDNDKAAKKPKSDEDEVDRMIKTTIRKPELEEPEELDSESLPIPPPPEVESRRAIGSERLLDRSELDKGAGLKCPICGGSIGSAQKYCPNCGADFEEEGGELESQIGKLEQELAEKRREPEAAVAGKISVPVAKVPGPEMQKEKEAGRESLPLVPAPDVPAARPEAKAVPAQSQREKSELRISELMREVPSRQAERPSAPSISASKPAPVVRRAVRKEPERPAPPQSRPAPVKIVISDYSERPPYSMQGRVNGTKQGRVNGTKQGRVNGTKQGRVNGTKQGRVNGTERGKVNGIKKPARPPEEEVRSSRLQTKIGGRLPMWQLLAILVVAILLISSAVVIFSMPAGTEGIKIDGYFSDWASTPSYQFSQVIPGALQGIDEGKMSFKQDVSSVSKLYLYLRLQSAMFAGSDASTIYVLIDTDENAETGYKTSESIGADILAILTGWNGSLEEASEARYVSTQDQGDWNSWQYLSGFPHALFEDEIEMSVDVQLTTPSVQIVTSIGGEEHDGPPMSPSGTILVKQEPLIDGSVTTASSPSVLRVSLRAMGTAAGDIAVKPCLLDRTGSETAAENFTVNAAGWTTRDLAADLSALSQGDGFSYRFSCEASGFRGAIDVAGESSSGYYMAYPTKISVDGIFGDWAGRNVSDADLVPIENPNIDIDEYGAATQNGNHFMYVGTVGEALGGADVPEQRIKSVPGGQGGGSVVKLKKTGEDLLQAFIDSDPSSGIGKLVVAGSASIEADYLFEIYGREGAVTSSSIKEWSIPDGKWIASTAVIEKIGVGTNGVEFSINKTLWGNLTNSEIIFFTTDWKARSDNCLLDGALSDPWAVGTAMSYRSNDGTTWVSTGSVSPVSGESVVAMAHSLDRSYVFAVTNTGRVYDWEVNVDTSWGPAVTDACNATDIVGIAPNTASGEGGCLILGSNGWTWTNAALGSTRSWTNATSKIADGPVDFKDVCYNSTGGRYWAIRSGVDTLAYYMEPGQQWNATGTTGSAAAQSHVYNVGDADIGSERVFILCEDGGIRYSADGGAGWASRGDLPSPGNSGLPSTSRYVAIDRDSNGVFWAITNSSHCYDSNDLGATWTYTGNFGVDNITSLACPIPYIPEFDSIIVPTIGAMLTAVFILAIRRRKNPA